MEPVAGPELALPRRMTFFLTCGRLKICAGISFLHTLEIKIAGLDLATHLPCLRLLNINVRACVCLPVKQETILQCPNSGAVAGSHCRVVGQAS